MPTEPILYRPPSEAKHPIIRLTYGCSHNRCAFCSMYRQVPFRPCRDEEIAADMARWAKHYPEAEAVFFADGNALCLETKRLLAAIERAKAVFPKAKRFNCYGSVMDIGRKSDEELALLREAGLDMIYIGLETGSPALARRLDLGFEPADYVREGRRLKACGLRQSISVITGLTDSREEAMRDNARQTAQAVSAVAPEHAAYLTLFLQPTAPLYEALQKGEIRMPTPDEALREIAYFLEAVDAPGTMFHANHASNFCSVVGLLNRDRDAMLDRLHRALDQEAYRPDWMRGL